MKLTRTACCLAFSVALAACGGGGGGSDSSGSTTTTSSSNNSQTTTTATPPALPAPDPSIATATVTRINGNCSATQQTGGYADKSFSVTGVYWIQTVGQDAINAPALASDATVLAAGKPTVVRVDVTGPYAYSMPTKATLTLGLPSGCKTYQLTTSAATAPVSANMLTLNGSFTVTIPAADLSGFTTANATSMNFMVATDTTYASTQASADRQFRSGGVKVQPAVSETLHVVPIQFQGQTGYYPSNSDLSMLIQRTMPQASATVTTDSSMTLTSLDPSKAVVHNGVYFYDYNTMANALGEVENYCLNTLNNGQVTNYHNAVKCTGFFPDNVAFGDPTSGETEYAGLGFTGGLASFVQSFTSTNYGGYPSVPQLTDGARTFVHEFGHVMTLMHAPCGPVPANTIDSRLYSDGSLGPLGIGYDSLNGFYFNGANSTSSHTDLMSYCFTGGDWTSDRDYRIVLDYKTNGQVQTVCSTTTNSSGQQVTSCSTQTADIVDGYTGPSQSNTTQRGVILFHLPNKPWQASIGPIPVTAQRSQKIADGGLISSVLRGVPVSTITSDAGESDVGPYYLPATPAVLQALQSGLSGITANLSHL